MKKRTKRTVLIPTKSALTGYDDVLAEVVGLLETARRASARTVNAIMTATYWEIGRRIVEFEQGGGGRAPYGAEMLVKLATDLTQRFGRGFSRQNLQQMRLFYLAYPEEAICQTLSGKSGKVQTLSGKSRTVFAKYRPRVIRQTASVESSRDPLRESNSADTMCTIYTEKIRDGASEIGRSARNAPLLTSQLKRIRKRQRGICC